MLRKLRANRLYRLLLESDAGKRAVSMRKLLSDYRSDNEGRWLVQSGRMRLFENAVHGMRKSHAELLEALEKLDANETKLNERIEALEGQPRRKSRP